ncbi:hypothetical protein HYH03_002660 [Edaphochlamys debaryana]|nr:hypothetical protein HYH03_002660 [Edaphochlamys debaryana]|eukprot:KAG2499727.1 hypothetical protein HYH03_002660 [Edaphochlamys debaryana]
MVEPAVYSSYVACIKLYQQGVSVTQSISSIDNRVVSFDITSTASYAVMMSGLRIYPPGAANCTCAAGHMGRGCAAVAAVPASQARTAAAPAQAAVTTVPASQARTAAAPAQAAVAAVPASQARTAAVAPQAALACAQHPTKTAVAAATSPPGPSTGGVDPFRFAMEFIRKYTIICELTSAAPPSGYVDIWLSTSVGGAYHTVIWNAPEKDFRQDLLETEEDMDDLGQFIPIDPVGDFTPPEDKSSGVFDGSKYGYRYPNGPQVATLTADQPCSGPGDCVDTFTPICRTVRTPFQPAMTMPQLAGLTMYCNDPFYPNEHLSWMKLESDGSWTNTQVRYAYGCCRIPKWS